MKSLLNLKFIILKPSIRGSEDISIKCDYIVSRAVTNLPKFINLTKHLFIKNEQSKTRIFYLKGGDFENELKQIHQKSKVIDLNQIFEEEFFETKISLKFQLSSVKEGKT